ncbi:MAG: MraZ protein [Polaribacter sp.]|jgi:MraZ protein
MPRGSNNISTDAKGRISIPTKHREDLLRESAGRMVVTISPNDRCLLMYTLTVWEAVERKLVALPSLNPKTRKLKRVLIGNADDCDMDGSGRILLPAQLREYAMINKKAVLVGQGDKYEIWDEALWIAHRDSILEEQLDESDLPTELETISF